MTDKEAGYLLEKYRTKIVAAIEVVHVSGLPRSGGYRAIAFQEVLRDILSCDMSESRRVEETQPCLTPTTERPESCLINCLVVPKDDETTPLVTEWNGVVTVRLDGYAIIPCTEYERLKDIESHRVVP